MLESTTGFPQSLVVIIDSLDYQSLVSHDMTPMITQKAQAVTGSRVSKPLSPEDRYISFKRILHARLFKIHELNEMHYRCNTSSTITTCSIKVLGSNKMH